MKGSDSNFQDLSKLQPLQVQLPLKLISIRMKTYNHILRLLLLVIPFLGCDDSKPAETPAPSDAGPTVLFDLVPASVSGVTFSNTIELSEEVNHLTWDAMFYGGGVAIGDLNNDGFQDLFFAGNQTEDALYFGNGDLTFNDVSEASGIHQSSGWSNGVAFADVNGDGWLDIYVCRSSWKMDNEDEAFRANALFINNQDGTFTNKAKAYGVDNLGYSTQATFFDYDHDNDLDLFLLNAPSNNLTQKVAYAEEGFPDFVSDRLFRNENGTSFTDVTEEAGVKAFSFGLGVVAADVNHDGWADIYVANDYERPDYLYINQQNGTFKNELNSKVKHTSFTAMGVDAADINNDGLSDLITLDMQSPDHVRSKTNMPTMQPEKFWEYVANGYNYQYMTNTLQLNHGAGFFTDIAQYAGVASTDWSWSALLVDLDQDSYKDLYVTNGINYDIRNNDFALEFQEKLDQGMPIDLFALSNETPSNKISNLTFRNGGALSFQKVQKEWGMDQPSFSYGAAVGDLDGDGDLEVVVNNNNEAPFIYKNNSTGKNWLQLNVSGPDMNPFGYGTKAFAYANGEIQYDELTVIKGYQSSSQPMLYFGLGAKSKVDSLIVIYPDGKFQSIKSPNLNQVLQVNYANAKAGVPNVYDFETQLFVDLSQYNADINWKHQEDNFDDFAREIILPHRESRVGPALAAADVNGDGVDEMYIGGAAGQAGEFMVRGDKAMYFPTPQPAFTSDKAFEDNEALFFDADGDGDLDLFVASGSYHLDPNAQGAEDRLYLNNEGEFKRDTSFDGGTMNSKALAASDIDNDGDIDLFVGGHVIPGMYPQAEPSRLFMNVNGKLVDVSEAHPELKTLGIVNRAEWVDFNQDGQSELLVTGEWMQPSVYTPETKSLKLLIANAENEMSGWWFGMEVTDVDNDGDLDVLLGNIGENNKFHADAEHPLKIYSADFDGNGTNDPVLSKAYKDHFVPVRGRECSSEQIPQIANKFQDFQSFADASIEEVLGDAIHDAYFREVKNFQSGICYNEGNEFVFVPFPPQAQTSVVNSFIVADFDGDGSTDIALAGNFFDTEVETTRYDAGNGLVLMGKGNRQFEIRDYLESGLYVPTNVRNVVRLAQGNGSSRYVFGVNNDRPISFILKKK